MEIEAAEFLTLSSETSSKEIDPVKVLRKISELQQEAKQKLVSAGLGGALVAGIMTTLVFAEAHGVLPHTTVDMLTPEYIIPSVIFGVLYGAGLSMMGGLGEVHDKRKKSDAMVSELATHLELKNRLRKSK